MVAAHFLGTSGNQCTVDISISADTSRVVLNAEWHDEPTEQDMHELGEALASLFEQQSIPINIIDFGKGSFEETKRLSAQFLTTGDIPSVKKS